MTGDPDVDVDVESALARVWAEVLGVPVDVEEDFVDPGGSSLPAGQIRTRVRRDLGTRLRPRDLFEDSTVAGMAARIRAARAAAPPDPHSSIAAPPAGDGRTEEHDA